MAAEERLREYARLAVHVGVNLQPGQILGINALVEHRAARPRRRARRPTRRARASSTCSTPTSTCAGPTSSTRPTTSWASRRRGSSSGSTSWPTQGGALLSITGNPEPELYADLDGGRVARSRMREVAEASLRLTDGACNWSIVAFPNEGWANMVFGEPDVERLWDAVATAVRLDEPDPWRPGATTSRSSARRAAALNERALRRAPLPRPRHRPHGRPPRGRRLAARRSTSRLGIKHVANMPTEEVFTTPDARRVDGTVRATYPLQLQGTIVRGLEVRFEGGRAVDVRADEGEELMRRHMPRSDDGAARLGEVALVDADSRVGRDGPDVLRHALRRERRVAHRARHGDRQGSRGRRRTLRRRSATSAA